MKQLWKYKLLVAFFLVFFSYFQVFSQKYLTKYNKTGDTLWITHKNLKTKDTNYNKQQFQQVLLALQQQGFLEAHIFRNEKAGIELGKQYFHGYLQIYLADSKEIKLLNNHNKPKPFNKERLLQAIENQIHKFECTGYPFVMIHIDSITLEQQRLNTFATLQKNQRIKMDDLLIDGEFLVNKQFIRSYLEIKKNQWYDDSKISEIDKKIRHLDFIALDDSIKLRFSDEYAQVLLKIRKLPANSFDALLGFQSKKGEPNTIETTGYIDLQLTNSLKFGEKILLNWRKLGWQSQEANTRIELPYLLGTPYGVQYQFSLRKIDTTYINIENRLGFSYYYAGLNYIKTYWESRKSQLLFQQSFTNSSNSNLLFHPSQSNLYGFELKINTIANKFNPSKGSNILINAATGKKNTEDDNQTLLLQKQSNIHKGEIQLEQYYSISKNKNVKFWVKSAMLYNKFLYENELIPIGGINSLRGFAENSILTSLYAITGLEYRIGIDKTTYLPVFCDIAYTEKSLISSYTSDRYLITGTGLCLQTKNGVFTINYAIGKQNNLPFDFRNSKVHIGYKGIF